MEDPREIAWQQRCDQHSHNNAIRVAFTAIYTRAIPNARIEQYYKSRIPSVKQWVVAKLELENALDKAEEEEGQAGVEENTQDHDMPDTDTGMDVVAEPRKGGKRKFNSGKRKTLSVKTMGRAKAVAGATKASVGTRAVSGKTKKKKSELERLLSNRDQGSEKPEAVTVIDDEGQVTGYTATGDTSVEDGPPISIPAPSPAEPASDDLSQVTKKSRIKSAPTVKPTPNTKSKRTPKPRTTISTSSAIVVPKFSKSAHPKTTSDLPEQSITNYGILPYIPGITEVIFNRYPFLHAQQRKKAEETTSTRLDTGRLVLMCMKATRQKNTIKAGVENSVVGGTGELVFLRRNVARVKRGLGIRE